MYMYVDKVKHILKLLFMYVKMCFYYKPANFAYGHCN